jgi:hypothetical protein
MKQKRQQEPIKREENKKKSAQKNKPKKIDT